MPKTEGVKFDVIVLVERSIRVVGVGRCVGVRVGTRVAVGVRVGVSVCTEEVAHTVFDIDFVGVCMHQEELFGTGLLQEDEARVYVYDM
jgi:hypothetical protein